MSILVQEHQFLRSERDRIEDEIHHLKWSLELVLFRTSHISPALLPVCGFIEYCTIFQIQEPRC